MPLVHSRITKAVPLSNSLPTLGVVVVLALVALPSAALDFPIVSTTNYGSETANNTSASSSFTGQFNGNPKPANTSKSPYRTLLYPGNTTKVYAHFMGWFGSSGHKPVGYISTDSAQVRKQVADMKSRGISGAILDWYGEGHYTDLVAPLLRAESERQGFTFAITEDVGAVLKFGKINNCDVTQQVITDLNYAYTKYENSPAYMRINGRPVVFFFGVEAYYVDWKRVREQVSGNPLFIFRNAGAFTDPSSDGAYAWVTVDRQDPYGINLSYLENFYGTGVQHPEKIIFGTGYPGFNDTIAGWINNRIMHRDCGRTWLASFKPVGKFYNTTRQLLHVQTATWNDYEEGTEHETGIDNCLSLPAWTSGNTLYWALEGEGPADSVSYFRVFISLDGWNLMKLADVSGSARSLSLSSWPLSTSITYKLYVKAIGKPSIHNKISNVIGYRRNNAVPSASLQLSTTSGKLPLTVTASTSASSDSDGSIGLSKIDFGDGTVVNGPTATHTYNDFNSFTVRAHVTDNRGATATSAQKVNVKPATSGVVITAPAPGANVANYFRITTHASGVNRITAMKLYVNGVAMDSIRKDRLDTYIRLWDGNYTIGVNAWDATGAVQTRSISIKVGIGTNDPPFPVLGLNTFTPAVNSRVRACTAASTDTNGISRSVVDFGDGSPSKTGTTTYHSYTRAGTYVVKATVFDSRGKSATTSTPVTVR
jgi:PKD repeat protein